MDGCELEQGNGEAPSEEMLVGTSAKFLLTAGVAIS